jgi:hypothetical protein
LDQAKEELRKMEAEIPEPDPVAYARMKYEVENATPRGFWSKTWGVFSKSPDVSAAAKSGQPTMTTMRPSIPVSIPIPGAQAGGVTDVTISTDAGGANTSALDTQPDARATQQQGQGAAPAAAATAPPDPTAPKNGEKKGDDKKKKQDKKK